MTRKSPVKRAFAPSYSCHLSLHVGTRKSFYINCEGKNVLIAIATDAWYPQPNGVVRVIGTVRDRLIERGHDVRVMSPDQFVTFPCPTYAEIPLAVLPRRKVARWLDELQPDYVHIATEGPIGNAARAYCLKKGWPFSTAFHTKFPEYLQARTKLPLDWLYKGARKFHEPSGAVMVPAPAVYRELEGRGFGNLKLWSHGVDTDVFQPGPKDFLDLPRPIFMFIGRVTVDKNLPGFLDLDLPGSKAVVGSGPAREQLMKRYPETPFFIADGDVELARYYNAADVFVFPSLTDTFGLVMLEALACGVPVAAFPVTGPLDVIGSEGPGVLDEDLARAAVRALDIAPDRCRKWALGFSWDRVADEFLDFLQPINQAPGLPVDGTAPRAQAAP
ncbi:MAG: glycosyltransferase family 1 protein [Rhodospirillales bacterium]|nr:glycosyltransferase family 1 protein [Rhodospirillales bacterium]